MQKVVAERRADENKIFFFEYEFYICPDMTIANVYTRFYFSFFYFRMKPGMLLLKVR
jgi:hypothetical protein